LYDSIKLWNDLPYDIKECKSYPIFNSKLRNFKIKQRKWQNM
jgi:hypothetical protein